MLCPRCGDPNAKRNGAGRGLCPNGGHTFTIRPDSGALLPVPDGYMAKGTSTLVGPDGSIKAQWIKTTRDEERLHEMQLAALDAMAAELPKLPPRKASGVWRTDLLTVYPIGDPHIGMYAWGEETGEDWDLGIAERVHCSAMRELVHAAPATDTAVVLNLGDMFHYDGLRAETPRSGHALDADGRYAKMIDVGVKILRQCIESALAKHHHVRVMNLPGNHDESSALFMSVALRHIYEREPRVSIEATPSVFQYYRFGKVLIGAHHGHTCKPEKLPGVMACDRSQDWGETSYRYWLTGHVHHEFKKEQGGCTVESFNTLAAKDAYAANGGWRSGRTMSAVIYHKDFGEVARSKVCAAMFEEAA